MKKTPLLFLGMVLIIGLAWVAIHKRQDTPKYRHITGQTMGNIVYNVKYPGHFLRLKTQIDSVLMAFNRSQSTYIPGSEISRLNQSGQLVYESPYFFPVLEMSNKVYKETHGAYDPSVGALVNAWGFGPGAQILNIDSAIIDSLMAYKGFNRIQFDEERVKMPSGFQLDFGAIAKGYAVDLIAMLLEENGVENYLVEIGGEVKCNGYNENHKSWSLGIEDPLVEQGERKILAIVRLRNKALATSGHYRNYYKKEGKTYAHIIDPRTGYHRRHNLLSASVFADNCMSADAYATAFMVLGLKESSVIVDRNDDLDAILVYQDHDGALRSYVSEDIKPYVELNRAN